MTILSLLTSVGACTEGTSAGDTGSVRVNVEFSGEDFDATGPMVTIDDRSSRPDLSAPVVLDDITPGEHQVTLHGLHGRCIRTGPATQTVVVTAGQSADVSFAVSCRHVDQLAIIVNRPNTPGGVALSIIDADGQRPHDVFTPGEIVAAPVWSRDGRRLAFRYHLDPDKERGAVYTVNADGTDLGKIWSDPVFVPVNMSWSPDGGRLSISANNDAPGSNINFYKLVVLDADGSNVSEFPSQNGFTSTASWAPDGSRFVFSARLINNDDVGLAGIYVADRQGAGLTQIPVAGLGAQWSPTGDNILVANGSLTIVQPDGGNPVNVPACPVFCASALWSPDGNRILIDDIDDVRIVGLDGTPQMVFPTNGIGGELGWSGSGDFLVWINSSYISITIIGADGSNPLVLDDMTGIHAVPDLDWRP